MENKVIDYSEYVEIAEGVFWVGFADESAGVHCNSYLIVDGEEAVLIDGGSRNDFSTVMLKIMRTGTNPHNISRLIYHHYDPDLCGNIPHMETVISNKDLKIISQRENNVFIEYYSPRSPKLCIVELGFVYEFANGRRLEFIRTPYSHSAGSFVTYDTKTKTLFSSDIFGSYDADWNLYTEIDEGCSDCQPNNPCPVDGKLCEITGIWDFHRRVMPSTKALKYAIKMIENLDISLIAPQHGSILHTPESRKAVIKQLKSMDSVGIEYYLKENNS